MEVWILSDEVWPSGVCLLPGSSRCLSNSMEYTTSTSTCTFVLCARLTQNIKNAMSSLQHVSRMNFSLANVPFPRMQLALWLSSREQSFAIFVTDVSELLLHTCARTHLLILHFLEQKGSCCQHFFLLSWLYLSGKDHHALI